MTKQFDFSGIWHSAYQYTNKLEPEGNLSEHDIKIYQTGHQLVLESVSEAESYFLARLTFDENLHVLTGTWEEETSPTGTYEGQVYYGTGQLLIDPDGDHMKGKVTVYNHEMQIICGDWTITRTKKSV
jgi:hypothetical protein